MDTIINYLFAMPFDVLLIVINLVKVNLYLILFYAIYRILLRNHTFFKLNRFYLLASLAFSLTLPFVVFTKTAPMQPMTLDDGVAPQGSSFEDMQQLTETVTDWGMISLVVYGSVALLMCFKLFKGFYNLSRIVRKNECLEFDEYSLVLLPETQNGKAGFGSFSFFKWLIVSYKDFENNLETILQHESVHIKQWHSLDIIFVEILKIIFWFNPVLWFYKISLCEVHEFLADERAENRDSYATFLIAYAQNSSSLHITNQFSNASLLKGRIKMIYKNRTSKFSLVKYLMILLLIGFIAFKTTARRTLYITGEKTQTKFLDNQVDTFSKSQKAEEHVPSEASTSSGVDSEKRQYKKFNSDNEQFKRKRNKSSVKTTGYNDDALSFNKDNAHDSLKDKKTKFINYRIIPIEMKEVKPFFPTLANSKVETTKFMNFSTKEVPKIEVQTYNLINKGSYQNGSIFTPVKYHKADFPK